MYEYTVPRKRARARQQVKSSQVKSNTDAVKSEPTSEHGSAALRPARSVDAPDAEFDAEWTDASSKHALEAHEVPTLSRQYGHASVHCDSGPRAWGSGEARPPNLVELEAGLRPAVLERTPTGFTTEKRRSSMESVTRLRERREKSPSPRFPGRGTMFKDHRDPRDNP